MPGLERRLSYEVAPTGFCSPCSRSPSRDFSRNQKPGRSQNPLSEAGVSGEISPPHVERPPPERHRIFFCTRPKQSGTNFAGRVKIIKSTPEENTERCYPLLDSPFTARVEFVQP